MFAEYEKDTRKFSLILEEEMYRQMIKDYIEKGALYWLW